jgi:hypothetical protein
LRVIATLRHEASPAVAQRVADFDIAERLS